MRQRDIEDIYELSPIQHGLLYETTRSPGAGIYVEQMSIHLDGLLDLGLFEQAWQRVVDRHPILRTGFVWQESGAPLQIVHRHARAAVERLDWSDLAEADLDAHYHAWLRDDRLTGFDLQRPPLMRLTLIRRGPRQWTFAWRFSHLIMDGWSFGIAIMDWLAHYRALRLGTTAPANRPRPYRDYVAWWRAHPAGDRERAFWSDELHAYRAPEPLRIEGNVAAGSSEPTHGYVHTEMNEIAGAVQRMAGERGLTVNTVIQGAWSILLGRYRGSEDVVAGSTVAHRPRDLPGAEGILGPLIVTLPLRVRIDQRRSVGDWLADFQRRQAAAREQAALPLVEIQRLARVAAPLLETSVSYENVPLPEVALEEIDLCLKGYFYDGRPHFPLTLVILPGERIPLRLVYDRRRFGDGAARQIVAQLRELLGSVAAAPEAAIGELTIRTEEERAAFEREARRPLPPAPVSTVLDRFADCAARRPDATAVAYGGATLSYAELELSSRALACELAARGVRRGDRVGLCLERSLELIVGLVGILRAGAAYVPLDPEYPVARLALLAAGSDLAAIVSRARNLDRLPLGGEHTMCVDIDRELPADGTLPAPPSVGDDMYLLYTSGSTGLPKGVPIRHGDVAAMLAACERLLEPCEEDVWAMFHSYGFDVSVLELWGALTTGGRVAVMPAAALRSPSALVRVMREDGVTITNQTPSAFEVFAAAEGDDQQGPPLSLRWVILAGERLDPARLRDWVARHGDRRPRVVNMFGITETTVVSSWRPIDADDVRRSSGSPIGVSLAHQRMYLLDERRQPVPRGVRGELYIGGHALARGYLDRDDLTAERFLPDPFAGGAARMYKTGDLARQRSDGSFEYIGRSDDQVQIRGFRVEPAEVEAALRELPGIRQAAVLAHADSQGETMLVAYVTGKAARIRDQLAERLPAFMLPGQVVVLEAMPRNASGKTDRRALPDPKLAPPQDAERVEPRSAAEFAMLEIVMAVLGDQTVGVLDDLTAHGMHSLAAMRIAVRTRHQWGVELEPRQLFHGATVASLAEAVAVREQQLAAT